MARRAPGLARPALVGDDRTLLDVVDGRLPFLLKVLAAAAPLSLQAHPTPAQAAEGFAREEAAGVPIDAPHRNYKDAFHKPELIYALSDPFRALSGFRPVAETRAVLEPVADDARIAPLLERLDDDDALRDVFAWLIAGGDDVDDLVAAVVEASATADGPSWQTVRTLADTYPGDPGIAISLLLHTVELRPGEVLYLPAGNIHAYLEGLGIELMAASDNVLRGGLTPKHVDVPELLSVLDFRPLPAPYLAPEEPEPGVRVFRPDVRRLRADRRRRCDPRHRTAPRRSRDRALHRGRVRGRRRRRRSRVGGRSTSTTSSGSGCAARVSCSSRRCGADRPGRPCGTRDRSSHWRPSRRTGCASACGATSAVACPPPPSRRCGSLRETRVQPRSANHLEAPRHSSDRDAVPWTARGG